MKQTPLRHIALTLLLLMSSALLSQAAKPLKVYILCGQSNMVGMATISTFPAIGWDPKTAPLLKEMQDAEGNPVVCEDVYITNVPKGDIIKNGKLTVGFGGGKSDKVGIEAGPSARIGPELTFGIYAHKLLGEPILLIKPAWGGKSLIAGFRPPSGGELRADHPQKYREGQYYKETVEYVKEVLADPKKYHPAYDPEAGYDLAGFVWFQGYNDLVTKDYPIVDESKGKESARDYSEYTRLLACFIRDIRKDLDAPKLPFVTGVFGMEGQKASENVVAFRKAQAATAEMPEFKGNVVNVFTEHYWPERIDELKAKELIAFKGTGKGKNRVFPEFEGEAAEIMEVIRARNKELSAIKSAKKKGEPIPESKIYDAGTHPGDAWREDKKRVQRFRVAYFGEEDAKLLDVGVSNQSYHYWGSTKFMAQAGKAFAEAVVELGQAAK